MTTIVIEQGDLTRYDVSSIVNAANNDLILGGGLAGAIARRGGPTIQEECNRIGPIEVGEAAITGAGRLPARYILHAASMRLGGTTSADSLAKSVSACLELAEKYQLQTVAFPAIGTGIACFPVQECAKIMLRLFIKKCSGPSEIEKIFIVLFDSATYNTFRKAFEELNIKAPKK